MQDTALPSEAEVEMNVTVTSEINFTALVAQHGLDRVGLFYGERPNLGTEN